MIVWTFAVGGKHTRASHVCTLSVRVRLFGFSIQMTTKELERQNGFERDREERRGTTLVMVSLLEGWRNVGLCSFSVPRSSYSLLRRPLPRRITKTRRLPSLRLRAALELEAIDSALTHSLTPSPSIPSLSPSLHNSLPVSLDPPSVAPWEAFHSLLPSLLAGRSAIKTT